MIESIRSVLEPDQIKTDQDSINIYAKDWTTYYKPNAEAILFPRSTEQVQQIVKWAIKNKTRLVPSGGRTGLSAAAVATNKEVVISFDKMNKINSWSAIDRTVQCQAGVITEALQSFVAEKGFLFPVDFASRGSSQIGGNIATNAGGIKVIRYGLFREWVTALTVVTGNGEILKLNNGLVKNAAGYDLRQLFIGSEGTLGFICEAELKFTKGPKNTQVIVMAIPKLEDVMKVYQQFIDNTKIQAFEFFSDEAMSLVIDTNSMTRPFQGKEPYYVLVELETDTDSDLETVLSCFEKSMEEEWVTDGVISQSAQQAKEFWKFREDIAECATPHSPYRNDVSVKVSRIPEFLQDIDQTLKREYPNYDVIWFGHIGDGNLHLDILKPKHLTNEDFLNECRRVDDIVFKSVEKFEGSVSAEHGVGLTKKQHLHHTRSKEEIEYFRLIKKCFDPHGIFNPGKVFDL